MKTKIFLTCISLALLTGCNKFLDQEPLSQLSPEQYLSTEENIAAYATDLYNTFPVLVQIAGEDGQMITTPTTWLT